VPENITMFGNTDKNLDKDYDFNIARDYGHAIMMATKGAKCV
jgi:hypothetical protein